MNLDFKQVGMVIIWSRNATKVTLEDGSAIHVIQSYGGPNVALWSGSVRQHYLT